MFERHMDIKTFNKAWKQEWKEKYKITTTLYLFRNAKIKLGIAIKG